MTPALCECVYLPRYIATPGLVPSTAQSAHKAVWSCCMRLARPGERSRRCARSPSQVVDGTLTAGEPLLSAASRKTYTALSLELMRPGRTVEVERLCAGQVRSREHG
eukprot:scaffold53060_cov29-Tisochrysis_lutea.AAC.2